jgi:glucuronokinase
MRCLMAFYDIEIPLEIQPSLALSVETDELGIAAGHQDRVIQCYEGMVYMDFAHEQAHQINGLTCYAYESMNPPEMPPLYLAYHTDLSEPTETFHNDIRGRYNRGEEAVVQAMQQFAEITVRGRDAIDSNQVDDLSALIDQNFDLRQSISRLPQWQRLMVETARNCGASAKFAGSGGAIIGTYHGEAMYAQLVTELGHIKSKVIKPQISA